MMLFVLISVSYAINCSSLTTNITIDIDSEPYIVEINSFFAYIPIQYNSQVFKCISYVKDNENDVIQSNPQKVELRQAKIPIFRKRLETREFFDAQNGVVNAYFTYDDMVAYTEFILGVRCTSNQTDLTGEKCITPHYKELKEVGTRSVWAVENTEMLLILVLVIIVIIICLGVIYRKGKKLL